MTEENAASRETVNVREAVGDDAEDVHVLACALADVTGDAHPFLETVRARLAELVEEPRAGVLVAENGEGVIGVVSFWIKPDLAHGDTVCEVPMLAVCEESRREGVGHALMAGVRERSAELGAALIELVTTPSNVAARDFYRSLGFVETDHIVLEFVGEMDDPPAD
jgi:ribosomal protein S18 acetylase RimI-like enzyme